MGGRWPAEPSSKSWPGTNDVLTPVRSLQPAFEKFLVASHNREDPYWGSEHDFTLLKAEFIPQIGRECIGFYIQFCQVPAEVGLGKEEEVQLVRSGDVFAKDHSYKVRVSACCEDSWWDWSDMDNASDQDRHEVELLVGSVLLGLIGCAGNLFTRISLLRRNFPESWVGREAVEAFCWGMQMSGCNTQDLNLDEIRAFGTVEGCWHIARMLDHNTSLKALALDNMGIGSEGARMLANSLKRNTELERLDIGRNPLGDDGTRYFIELLSSKPSIRWLYMSGSGGEWLYSQLGTAILEWDW